MDNKFDRVASVLFLAVGLAFAVGSKQLSATAYGSSVGPDIFPFSLGVLLIILSIRLFYEAYKRKNSEKNQEKIHYKPFLIIFAATIIYALSLETVGYVITTFVFLFVCFQVMERSKWVVSLFISAVFSGAVYFLFVEVLKGTLPGWPVWF
ncbi:tripartite tricarboxylate transporter TctB family protein [Bacillus sp. FJAT-27445]|uniref:tripartite tricarboxylate transporter TctB family protein n=1 Tax=Bacillus sp. FJAT-27445 TaxID=1679166 RepID=UPI0007436114|nr:tripartite tricarboxylate transporter TctB family protein [Bacillus sp. FJAT-27445]